MTSDHRLIKSQITLLSSSVLSSPAWSTRSNLIVSILQRLYTPSFSDPRPCLTRAPSWKTLWAEIYTQDPEDGRWWAPIDSSKIPVDVHSAAQETLLELRAGLGLYFQTTMRGKGFEVWVPEDSLNPFDSPSDEIIWETLRPESPSPEGSTTIRLKLALRWTDDSFKRYRVKYITREFSIDLPQMKTIRLRADGTTADGTTTTRALRGMGGKEFEHLEYAHIPYHHHHHNHHPINEGTNSSSITLSLSDQTLVGSSYEGSLKKEKEEEVVSEQEVKAWAAQFGKKQGRGVRWKRAKKGVVVE